MICEVRPGGHYGYGGPRTNQPPDLPLVYLPRGLDNSSGAQVTVPDDRFGPLQGQLLHFSFGAGTYFLLLREKVDGQPQGRGRALARRIPLGAHRGRFNPRDGQLYVIRHDRLGHVHPGRRLLSARALHRRAGPATARLPRPRERRAADVLPAARPSDRRAGRSGTSPRPGTTATAPATARPSSRRATRASPATTRWRSGRPTSWPTAGALPGDPRPPARQSTAPASSARTGRAASTCSPRSTGWRRPSPASPATSPRQDDRRPPDPRRHGGLESSTRAEPVAREAPGARADHDRGRQEPELFRPIVHGRAGEPIKLTFINPDVVPHNWALIKPGTLTRVGDLVNKIIAEPDAASRHYIPRTRRRPRLHRHRRPAGPVHDLVPRPRNARPISLSLHVPRPLDGHERGDDRRVSGGGLNQVWAFIGVCDWPAIVLQPAGFCARSGGLNGLR